MSNKIIGARVKNAAIVHARKQLRHLGFAFESKSTAVTFEGTSAYATWTPGREAQELNTWRINYPNLADNAMLSRREADFISAYTLHELGHIAHTDNNVVKSVRGCLFHLWNGLEDARIEHAIIAGGKARGARSMFKKLMSKYTFCVGEDFNPCLINHAPFALALVARAAYGDGNGYAKTLLSRIPEPYAALYATVCQQLLALPLDRSGSADVLSLARVFLDGWKIINPDAFIRKPKPEPSQPGDPGQPGDAADDADDTDTDADIDADTADKADEADTEDADDSDDAFGGDKGSKSSPANDEDYEDYNDYEDEPLTAQQKAQEAAESEADKVAEALAQEAQNHAEEAEESESSLLDALESGDSDDDSSSTGPSFSPPSEPDVYDDDLVVSPEPKIDDLFSAAEQRTRSPISLPRTPGAGRSEMRKWESIASLTDQTKKRHLKKLNTTALPALKAQLYRILKAPELFGWDSGALGGRFDGARTPKLFAGSERVFKRRWERDGIDTAISIVIDLSGSMKTQGRGSRKWSDPIGSAVDLAWTLASACESARAEVEVVGFQTSHRMMGWAGGEDISGVHQGQVLQASSMLVVAKRFADRLSNTASYFEAMKKIPAGSTPDYACVKTAVESLSLMPQQRKVCIVITDGYGDTESMGKLGAAAHGIFGVDVIGFGIGCSAKEFAQAYPVGCPVSLDSLHKSGLKNVIKQLELRDTRRAA